MVQLSAQDAVSSFVLKVSGDMRWSDLTLHQGMQNYEAYAVFSESDQISANQFLGIVPKYMVGRYPYRIFADLLTFSKSSIVEPSTSLDILYTEFQQKRVDAFSVMEAKDRLIGVVTPTSLLETLWVREQTLTARLKKEISGKLHAENQLQKVHHELDHLLDSRGDFLLDHKKQLMALSHNLIATEKRERENLAGELHDHLAQILTLGQIKLAQASRLTNDPSMESLLNGLEKILRESLTYTRTLMTELNSAQLHQCGLLKAFEDLKEKFIHFGLDIHIESELPLPELSEQQNFLLYWSVRELLFNVIKHARVEQATVNLQPQGDTIQCIVADRGQGFSMADQEPCDVSRPGHLGLTRINERMNALNGTIHIQSLPGQGTQVTLTLPLTAAR